MSRLDKKFIDALAEIFGGENVSTDLADRTCYSYDFTRMQSLPDVVVWARDACKTHAQKSAPHFLLSVNRDFLISLQSR